MLKDINTMHVLQNILVLPCGAILKNRLAKSAMSDSLADGEGNPTEAQIRLYERWAQGGAAISFIGEVQGDPRFPERPGNLVLGTHSNQNLLKLFTRRASIADTHLWPQIGHAGALSYMPISQPKGPSPLDIHGLQCAGMSMDEMRELPSIYARTAAFAKQVGFSGVHIHAGHGFLLSQFLSPLFNHRQDGYGGSIEARCRIIIEIIGEIRRAVGPYFPVGIRINATDQLEGGLDETDALEVVRMLDATSIDLVDISGGTYFPGAKASSESSSQEPYFLTFAKLARKVTSLPLMVTGGFKRRDQAINAVASGTVDMVGLARSMVLDAQLAAIWLSKKGGDIKFPKFENAPPGGITAWYTMRLTALAEDREDGFELDLQSAIREYEERDIQRCIIWKKRFLRL
jgi:2,4-dienoyl-CoA reductase-like NADH-dependent reductase (Old Yellow Enzyme family)